MGKIYDSLLSGTSGRTGRIVVANMFGNEFTKIRPRKRTSAPSAKQLLIYQRMRLSADGTGTGSRMDFEGLIQR